MVGEGLGFMVNRPAVGPLPLATITTICVGSEQNFTTRYRHDRNSQKSEPRFVQVLEKMPYIESPRSFQNMMVLVVEGRDLLASRVRAALSHKPRTVRAKTLAAPRSG